MFENTVKKLLKNGAVGVIPTDTLYGIVCRAEDRVAVKRLYDLQNQVL
jgi:tRNA A37 threonylcarbamoyladenosine synthetase subunit TsaC/SUA5/YrdC